MVQNFRDISSVWKSYAKSYHRSFKIEFNSYTLYFFSLDNIEKIRGMQFDRIYVRTIVDSDTYYSVIIPSVRSSGGRVVLK